MPSCPQCGKVLVGNWKGFGQEEIGENKLEMNSVVVSATWIKISEPYTFVVRGYVLMSNSLPPVPTVCDLLQR
jgi:hypothetical protein